MASSTARTTASASACWRTMAEPETSCSLGGSTNTTVTIATSWAPTRTICALSTSMHSAAVSSWRSASTVAVATRRWRAVDAIEPSANPTASSSPPGERDPDERPEPADLGGAVDEDGPELGRGLLGDLGVAVAVGGAAELDDRDDPAVELDPEAGQGDRLDVPDHLLRVLGGVGEDVDLGGAAARVRHHPGGRDLGQPAELPLELQDLVLGARRACPSAPTACSSTLLSCPP